MTFAPFPARRVLVDLVSRRAGPAANVSSEVALEFSARDRSLEPMFDNRAHAEEFLSFLQRRIARDPRDLLGHTQRILLLLRRQQADACYAAMLDLLSVLGTGGAALKRNLYRRSQGLLIPPQRQTIRSLIASGSIAEVPESPLRLLGVGQCGHRALVYLCLPNGAATESPGDVAYWLLEHDRVTECRVIWERLLQQDPGDATTTMELLSIYQHYQMKQAFYATYLSLASRKLALPDLWAKLDRQFSQTCVSRTSPGAVRV